MVISKEDISEYMSKLGKKGGRTNKKKGKEYFSRIGKLGSKKRWKKSQ